MSFNIGIDFKGVLFKPDKDNGGNFIEIDNSYFVIKYLVEKMNCNLYLISACGKKKSIFRNNCLIQNGYIEFIKKQFYLGTRKFKYLVCNDLSCHFMIDDREDILNKVKLFNSKIITILFVEDKNKNEVIVNHNHLIVNNWLEILEIISSSEYFESEFTPIIERNEIINQEYHN